MNSVSSRITRDDRSPITVESVKNLSFPKVSPKPKPVSPARMTSALQVPKVAETKVNFKQQLNELKA